MAKQEEKEGSKKLQGSFFGNMFSSKSERIDDA